jgi:hypothetical protein
MCWNCWTSGGARGEGCKKHWEEQTEQAIGEWQRKAARIVELIFPPKGAEPEEEDRRAFPIDALPPVFRDLAVSIAKTHKSEDKMGVIALPLIGVFSATLGQGIRVQTSRYISYPNVFVYCSVGSGGIKSVALDEAWAPVKAFQAASLQRHDETVVPQTLAKKHKIEAKIKALTENFEVPIGGSISDDDDGELGKLFHQKSELDKDLIFCPVKLDDATPESLVTHGITHGRVFVCTDEASIVTSIILGRYSKGFTNDGPLCKIWSSGDLSRSRKDAFSYNPRVTGAMVLMGQEHITERMFQDEDMITSGFIPRFLFLSCETPMLKRNRSRLTVCENARAITLT